MHLPFRSIYKGVLYLLPLLFALLAAAPVRATHIRAGEINARTDPGNPLRFNFTLILYTDRGSSVRQADATLKFGDGTEETVLPVPPGPTPVPGSFLNTDLNVFQFNHTYNAPGLYKVSFTGENRNAGILNMASSSTQTFYIDTEILVDPFLGPNRTPLLTIPPIDVATSRQVFKHNPGGFDFEGDSIVFKMIVPRRNDPGLQQPNPSVVAGYTSPADPIHGGQNATLTLGLYSGNLVWDVPVNQGEYNIAFVVEEWRSGVRMSVTTRDMQIQVRSSNNRKPVITLPRDLCVIPGTMVQDTIVVTDPDNNPVTCNVFTNIDPNAYTFNRIGNTNRWVFTWNTPVCANVRELPFRLVFKAQDEPANPIANPPLVDFATWLIRVVGPPPQNVRAVPSGKRIQLSWDAYACQNAQQLTLWRKVGTCGFVPDSCQTGVPPGMGYQKIADLPITATSYTDADPQLKRCENYAYVLVAEFPLPGRGVSYPSEEICARLLFDVPLLTNVTVTSTEAANGSILVQWVKPQEGLDPNSTYTYVLRRGEGISGQAPVQTVFTTTNLNDTSFVDSGLNTSDKAYNYRIEFYVTPVQGATQALDTTASASSVRLALQSGNKEIQLTWRANVPWNNRQQYHRIYRQINNSFVLIDSVLVTDTVMTYTDRGTFQNQPLREKETYCYYVQTAGAYDCPLVPDTLLNNSQQACRLLEDLTPPCPPILTLLKADCETFDAQAPYRNQLSWTLQELPDCDNSDIAYFTVYYSPTATENLTEIIRKTRNLEMVHDSLVTLAGCYEVTATDSSGNESARSNRECQDNCLLFELPNIITPNGDGANDDFRPKSRFVRSEKYQIFNRWGAKVYEVTIGPGSERARWRGQSDGGARLADGVYYYTVEVEFYRLDPNQPRAFYKGWVELVR